MSTKANCFIGGCAKNCSKYIEKVFTNIKQIGKLFDEIHILIAYDQSEDNTLDLLMEQKKTFEKMDILTHSNPVSHVRTQNICNARNLILNKIKKLYNPQWEYFIMMDCDDVCTFPMDLGVLERSLERKDWDALSFNREFYYDIWALSYDPYIFSCWNWPNPYQVIEIMTNTLKKKLSKLGPDELFPCLSAFNGFAIYRTEKFLLCIYEWKTPLYLMTNEELEANIKAVGSIPFRRHDDDDCEHRSFHLQAIKKTNAKIRISPEFFFLGSDKPNLYE